MQFRYSPLLHLPKVSLLIVQLYSIKTAKKTSDDARQKVITDTKTAYDAKMKSDVMYFAQVKAKEIFENRFTSVEKANNAIVIHFKLLQSLTPSTGFDALSNSAKVFEAFKGRADYNSVNCQGSFPMVDKNGNNFIQNVFVIELDRDTIDKTTFANIQPTGLIPLASIHNIRPELLDLG